MRVHLKTAFMNTMNAFRGIGTYTLGLSGALKELQGVEVVEKKPDIIHYPYFDLYFHTLPIIEKKPRIVTIHDVIPLVFRRQYAPGIKGRFRFYLQSLALKKVQAVITDSECSKKDIVKYLHVPSKKVFVVYLSSNPEMKRQSEHAVELIKKKYSLPEKYVLYVGDINYNKNIKRLIESCSKLPSDIHLVMVGKSLKNTEIPEGKEIAHALEHYHMSFRTHLLTDVPRSPSSDLSSLFSGALCYVQPSLYEGFGLPVLDAMACETVVVSSHTSSLPEVGGDACIYCDPYSIESMKEAIVKACTLSKKERSELLLKMKENLKRFSWKKTAKETLDVYKHVLGENA